VGIGVPNPALSSQYFKSLPVITGTASDNYAIRKSTPVEISILDNTNSKYWLGSGWSDPGAARTWLPLTLTSTWTYTTAGWITPNIQYYVYARSWDRANNFSTTYSTAVFVYDNQAPASILLLPPTQTGVTWENSLLTISGTAQDNSQGQVKTVSYAIKNMTTKKWWSGSDGKFNVSSTTGAWNSVPSNQITNHTGYSNGSYVDWYVNTNLPTTSMLTTGTTYAFCAQAGDAVSPANVQTVFSTGTFTWM